MNILDIFRMRKVNSDNSKIGYVSAKNEIKESFKGEVRDTMITFPKTLGAEHPFNFEAMEKVYKSVGIITGGVNKITDSVVGDFSFKTKNEKSELIIKEFIKDTNFTSTLREWIREGFVKGNGFLELDVDDKGIKVLNANDMYVNRDDKGNVTGYKQWVGNLKRYTANSTSLVEFKPNEIAHLRINKISGEPYGIGIIWPNERVIENLVINEQDLHKLISRKAGAPIHAKVGIEGEAVNTDDIDALKDDLKVINNRTEWVTDANVNMGVIDFGDIGKNLTDTLNHDMLVLAYGMEIPIVLFGAGNIPEGLAKVQMEIFQRKMSTIREEIESIIEEHIFKPLLEKHGIKDEVDFSWTIDGEEEINNRIDKLTKLIESMNTSEPLRRMCEIKIAELLGFKEDIKYLTKPEKETDEQKASTPGTPPENNDEDDTPPKEMSILEKYDNAEEEIKAVESGEIELREYINLKESQEFNYSDYLDNILKILKIDKFEYLAAVEKGDIANGKLPKTDIEKLRIILGDGFKDNKSIAKIESDIKSLIILKDVKKDGKVITDSALRPKMIARTETVRLANAGLIKTYKEKGVEKVEWLAAVSDRTCEQCMKLDGQVFDIDTVSAPPIHPMCRCSLLTVRKK